MGKGETEKVVHETPKEMHTLIDDTEAETPADPDAAALPRTRGERRSVILSPQEGVRR